jgi:hypothetical protein
MKDAAEDPEALLACREHGRPLPEDTPDQHCKKKTTEFKKYVFTSCLLTMAGGG